MQTPAGQSESAARYPAKRFVIIHVVILATGIGALSAVVAIWVYFSQAMPRSDRAHTGPTHGTAGAREMSIIGGYRDEFIRYKELADRAIAQIDAGAFFESPGAETNSIATIVKHLGGNLRSRWRDFLTTDGEKPDRDRDNEFVLHASDTMDHLMARWEEGWTILFDTLRTLRDDDLTCDVTIRGEPWSVSAALARSMGHAAYHSGQIVLLARHYAGPGWTSLSIPKGGSGVFNAKMAAKFGDSGTGA